MRRPCGAVTRFDDGLAQLVTDLMDTCRLPGRAGLAAPQIGVSLRVFSYWVDGDEGYLVNPELVAADGTQEDPEGCLSVGDIYLPTRRAEHAVVKGVDVDQRPVVIEGTGLLARCLQHELDHLDGFLFIDRVGADDRRRALSLLRNREMQPGPP